MEDFCFPRNCFIVGPTGPSGGPTGPTGATGPTGSFADTTTCSCVNQMRNVIQQLQVLYPNTNLIVSMESGNNVSGRIGSLIPGPNNNPNSGLLELVNNQGIPQEAISLCRIAAIRLTSETYNDAITYLPTPDPLPTGCDTNCEEAIRTYLPINTPNVSIQAGSRTVATGSVLKNEFGMVVIVGPNNNDPTFVSLCKAEIITK